MPCFDGFLAAAASLEWFQHVSHHRQQLRQAKQFVSCCGVPATRPWRVETLQQHGAEHSLQRDEFPNPMAKESDQGLSKICLRAIHWAAHRPHRMVSTSPLLKAERAKQRFGDASIPRMPAPSDCNNICSCTRNSGWRFLGPTKRLPGRPRLIPKHKRKKGG